MWGPVHICRFYFSSFGIIGKLRYIGKCKVQFVFAHTNGRWLHILTAIINIIKVGYLPLLFIIGRFYRSVYLKVIHIDAQTVKTKCNGSIDNGFQSGLATSGIPAVS